ncbi:LOG family protein [Paenimyroides baculatum]|uniref:Cytokinin riboside 5'-monophosphate phosphoribohydrolase n=1 Tax=Paenimyroides baculatum TaxID=2608000 RepID=A0A5M6CN05_9FLAO|nr:TIGR00730 family Rossman fold protein [Paenimyroides baculatum]KAA5535770.1 TIGR00730 family Rossman fold protein [Paenimyroides baculatum]
MKSLTVFCGSSFGNIKQYEDQAYELGKKLAERNIDLVYGGANVGLMGAVANGALESNGKVIGVLPNFLRGKEIAHNSLSELIIVETMHERKTKMNELSDGVITLPGGYGTLEEFFEMLTWAQLGLHKKPIAVLNINGFYNELLSLIEKMVSNGFLKQVNQQMLLVSDNIDELLNMMADYEAPVVEKWVTKEVI